MSVLRTVWRSIYGEGRSMDLTLDLLVDRDGFPRGDVDVHGRYGEPDHPDFAPLLFRNDVIDFGPGKDRHSSFQVIGGTLHLGKRVTARWNKNEADNEDYAIVSMTELD